MTNVDTFLRPCVFPPQQFAGWYCAAGSGIKWTASSDPPPAPHMKPRTQHARSHAPEPTHANTYAYKHIQTTQCDRDLPAARNLYPSINNLERLWRSAFKSHILLSSKLTRRWRPKRGF